MRAGRGVGVVVNVQKFIDIFRQAEDLDTLYQTFKVTKS